MRTVDRDERRALLVAKHGLDRSCATYASAARAVVGFHSSDPASVYLSGWARVEDLTKDDVATALYEDRTVVRHLGMRRTMFVVPRDTADTMNAGATAALYATQRNRVVGLLEKSEITDDGEAWLDAVGSATYDALAARGTATARELTEDVPELATRVYHGKATFGMSTRMLFLLSVEGRIIRGRPRGSWISSQYEWSTVEQWIGQPFSAVDETEARAELLLLWLDRFGPATETDCAWWTGWNLGHTRDALRTIDAEQVSLDGGTAYAVGDADLGDPVESVALLPALDPTPMGWKERDWFLGGHEAALFDRNGNIGPTVWANGAVVGGWGQTEDGAVHVRLLEQVDSTAEARIHDEAEMLAQWLDGVQVKPRFPTPTEKAIRLGPPFRGDGRT